MITGIDMKDGKKEAGRAVWLLTAMVRGIGQVMLQRNVWGGVLMLAGLALGAWQMALAALAGSAAGLACARLAGYGRQDVGDGLYGFNGALVGLAVASVNGGLLGYNAVLCAIALGGRTGCSAWWTLFAVVLSVILQVAGMRAGIPTLTAPFVLSVWVTMGLRNRYN